MHNRYTVEIHEVDNQIKAVIYLNKECLGTVWRPNKTTSTKEEFTELFESVANIVYGKEVKANKEQESYSKILEAIEAANSARQA